MFSLFFGLVVNYYTRGFEAVSHQPLLDAIMDEKLIDPDSMIIAPRISLAVSGNGLSGTGLYLLRSREHESTDSINSFMVHLRSRDSLLW